MKNILFGLGIGGIVFYFCTLFSLTFWQSGILAIVICLCAIGTGGQAQ